MTKPPDFYYVISELRRINEELAREGGSAVRTLQLSYMTLSGTLQIYQDDNAISLNWKEARLLAHNLKRALCAVKQWERDELFEEDTYTID